MGELACGIHLWMAGEDSLYQSGAGAWQADDEDGLVGVDARGRRRAELPGADAPDVIEQRQVSLDGISARGSLASLTPFQKLKRSRILALLFVMSCECVAHVKLRFYGHVAGFQHLLEMLDFVRR